MLDRCVVKTYC